MKPSDQVRCQQLPCADVDHAGYRVPSIELDPAPISIILVSESAPVDPRDDYYAPGEPLFGQTTVAAFRDAGADVTSVRDILELGVYLTTAVKCPKTGYAIDRDTVDACSFVLQRELALFPQVRAILLMGDTAIRSLNRIAVRCGVGRIFPSQPTYRLRAGYHEFRGMRLFPSYLQAGPAFFIEKSKRRMIAEDIAAALRHASEAVAAVR
jgi:uracil-DNA glycosylase